MKSVLILACALLLPVASLASANEGGDTYQRQRMQGGQRGFYGGRHYRQPWYGGYYYQPQVSGSWYARPYPHHFDYYRRRYSTPPTPPVDYPCADGLETTSQ